MESMGIMTDNEQPMIWSSKARETLKRKLSPIAIDWLSTVMEVTEHKQKTT